MNIIGDVDKVNFKYGGRLNCQICEILKKITEAHKDHQVVKSLIYVSTKTAKLLSIHLRVKYALSSILTQLSLNSN